MSKMQKFYEIARDVDMIADKVSETGGKVKGSIDSLDQVVTAAEIFARNHPQVVDSVKESMKKTGNYLSNNSEEILNGILYTLAGTVAALGGIGYLAYYLIKN